MRLGLAVLFLFCLAGFFFVDAVQVRGGVFIDIEKPITQWALLDAVYDVARHTRPFDKGALAILWTIVSPIAAFASALTLATSTGRRALWFLSGIVICASALWINLLGKASGGEFVFQGFLLAGMGATCSFWSLLLERRRRVKRRLTPFHGPERTPQLTDQRTPPSRAAPPRITASQSGAEPKRPKRRPAADGRRPSQSRRPVAVLTDDERH